MTEAFTNISFFFLISFGVTQAMIEYFFGSDTGHYSNKIVSRFCKHAIAIYAKMYSFK